MVKQSSSIGISPSNAKNQSPRERKNTDNNTDNNIEENDENPEIVMSNQDEGAKELINVFNCINSIPPLHTEIEYLEDFLTEYDISLIKTSS